MILKEVLDSMKSVHEPGIPSDDSLYSYRRMYSKLLRIRAEIIFQKSNKGQTISEQDYQWIPCLKMNPVPLIECPCVPALGTYVLKSEHKLPRFLTGISGNIAGKVTTLDGEQDFDKTTWDSKTFNKGRKYTSKVPDYFFREQFLYITHNKTPAMVMVYGVFEDPLEIYNYPSSCCEDATADCVSNLDREFPIDRGTFNAIMELVKKEATEIRTMNVPEDTMNNSMSDSSAIK